uniref:Uncharacterized protein n=1 Tax=Pseudochorda nagaii TaxID=74379 RepID=A0A8F0FCX5_9PHAE|nr:hypothetical protein [Pseudochorda nagaii]
MVKVKKHSENDLVKYYESCPIFKKYCQFDLWSEDFCEYENIKYCETYLSLYTYAFIQRLLFDHFSPSCLAVLYTSPYFVKFVRSGFFKYVDYHFLLSFHNNCFFYPSDSGKKIEAFVEVYFERYIKFSFAEDLVSCLVKSFTLFLPRSLKVSFIVSLNIFLKIILGEGESLSILSASCDIAIDEYKSYSLSRLKCNDILLKKIPLYFEPSFFSDLSLSEISYTASIQTDLKIFVSYRIPESLLGGDLVNSSYTLFEDTTYNWDFIYTGRCKGDVFKSLLLSPSIFEELSPLNKYFEKVAGLLCADISGYEWCLCSFLKVPHIFFTPVLSLEHPSGLLNSDIQVLIHSLESLEEFDSKKNDIGIYKEISEVFVKGSKVKVPLKSVVCTVQILDDIFKTHANKSALYLDNPCSKLIPPSNSLLKEEFMRSKISLDNTIDVSLEPEEFFLEDKYKALLMNIDEIFETEEESTPVTGSNSCRCYLDTFFESPENLLSIFFSFLSNLQDRFEESRLFEVKYLLSPKSKNINSKLCDILTVSEGLGKSPFIVKSKNQREVKGPYFFRNVISEWSLCCSVEPDNWVASPLFIKCSSPNSTLTSYRYFNQYAECLDVWPSFYLINTRVTWGFCSLRFDLNYSSVQVPFLGKSLESISKKYANGFCVKRSGGDFKLLSYTDNKEASRDNILEVCDYEDDLNILEEFIVDHFSK